MTMKVSAAAAAVVLFFVSSFAFMSYHHLAIEITRWEYGASDFLIWYRAGVQIASPERSEIYSVHVAKDGSVSYGAFFNPPALAFVFWPLTLLEFHPARVLFLWLSLACAGGLLAFAWALGLRGRAWGFAVLALASFWPLYLGIEFGHPAPMYAVLGGLGLLELERQASASAGGFVGLLALKPSLLVGQLGYIFWKRQWLTFATACAVGAVIFFGPFLVLGFDAFNEFRVQGSKLTADGFSFAHSQVTIGSWGMLNWNGYVSSLILDDPPIPVVFVLDALTVLAVLRVWARGTLREAWFVSTGASLLMLPHLLAYDWLMIFVPAAALVAERRTWPLVVLLLAVHLGVNLSIHVEPYMVDRQIVRADFDTIRDLGGLWGVPALFLTIVYLAFRREIEARLHLDQEPARPVLEPVAAVE